MFDPSPAHLLMLGLIVLLVMGPKRLPELARSLGHGMREFRGSLGAPQATEPPVAAPAEGELVPGESAGVDRAAA